MSAIQGWTAGVCFAVLAVAILQQILPDGAMRRMAELAVGAFFLCAVLAPLAKAAPDLSLFFQASSQPAREALRDTVETQRQQAVRASLENLIAAQLVREGIFYKKIEVFMDMDEDGGIVISKVAVILPQKYAGDCGRAAASLSEALGMTVEVTADAGMEG